MRHKKKINHLGRKSQHRKAMLSNMASSLILHKRIFTTVAKAKALRVYVEPLISKSKEDSTHSRRTVFSYLGNKYAVSELFREVAQKVADRPGGYTRILKTGQRKGDAAEMCFIELVDYNLNMLKTAEDAAKKTRRSRRGKKSASGAAKAATDEQTSVPEPETKEIATPTTPADSAVEETKAESLGEVKSESDADTPKEDEASEDKPAQENNKKSE